MHEALRQAREDAHFTQQYVAEHMGVTQGAVHCWESGRTQPKADKLTALANLYGCSVDNASS